MNKYLLFCILIVILLLLLDHSDARNNKGNKSKKSNFGISKSKSGSRRRTQSLPELSKPKSLSQKKHRRTNSEPPAKTKSLSKHQRSRSQSRTRLRSTLTKKPKHLKSLSKSATKVSVGSKRQRKAKFHKPSITLYIRLKDLIKLEEKTRKGLVGMHDLLKQKFNSMLKKPANKWTPDEEKEVNAFMKFFGATRVIDNANNTMQVNDVNSETAIAVGGTSTNNVMTMPTPAFINKMDELIQKNTQKIEEYRKSNPQKAQVLSIMNEAMKRKIAELQKLSALPAAPTAPSSSKPQAPSNPPDYSALLKALPYFQILKKLQSEPNEKPAEEPKPAETVKPAEQKPTDLQQKIQELHQQAKPNFAYDSQLVQEAQTVLDELVNIVVPESEDPRIKNKIGTGASLIISPPENPEEAINHAFKSWKSENAPGNVYPGEKPNLDKITSNSKVGCAFKNIESSEGDLATGNGSKK